MKKFVRTVCLILCVSLLGGACSFPAFAADVLDQEPFLITTSEVSEYEMYLSAQSLSPAVLAEQGFSDQQIETLKTKTYEELTWERAQLSEKELLAMGYAKEQIAVLKTYDGSDLSEHPEIVRISPNFRGFLHCLYYSKTKISARFSWEWSVCPIIVKTDILACAWNAINPSGVNIAVQAIPSSCSSTINYVDGSTTKTVRSDITFPNLSGSAKTTFKVDAYPGYPKMGHFDIMVEPATSATRIHTVYFSFGYGHTTIDASPTVSFGLSGAAPSLTFSYGVEEMYNKSISINIGGETAVSKYFAPVSR